MFFGELNQNLGKLPDTLLHRVNFIAQVQPDVEGDLIVPATRGMQFAADRSRDLNEPLLDVHVDVFQTFLDLEFSLLELL